MQRDIHRIGDGPGATIMNGALTKDCDWQRFLKASRKNRLTSLSLCAPHRNEYKRGLQQRAFCHCRLWQGLFASVNQCVRDLRVGAVHALFALPTLSLASASVRFAYFNIILGNQPLRE